MRSVMALVNSFVVQPTQYLELQSRHEQGCSTRDEGLEVVSGSVQIVQVGAVGGYLGAGEAVMVTECSVGAWPCRGALGGLACCPKRNILLGSAPKNVVLLIPEKPSGVGRRSIVGLFETLSRAACCRVCSISLIELGIFRPLLNLPDSRLRPL